MQTNDLMQTNRQQSARSWYAQPTTPRPEGLPEGGIDSGRPPAQIRADLIREHYNDYTQQLSPLESFYAGQFLGPQAQLNQEALLQHSDTGVLGAYRRAGGRQQERDRKYGTVTPGQGQERQNQIATQGARVENQNNVRQLFEGIQRASI